MPSNKLVNDLVTNITIKISLNTNIEQLAAFETVIQQNNNDLAKTY